MYSAWPSSMLPCSADRLLDQPLDLDVGQNVLGRVFLDGQATRRIERDAALSSQFKG